MRNLVLERLSTSENDIYCSSEFNEQHLRQSYHSDSLSSRLCSRISSGDVFCSFEFTPPKCHDDLQSLIERASCLQNFCNPLFHAVTSHVTRSSTSDHPGLQLTQSFGREDATLLHLVAGQLTTTDVHNILGRAREAGIKSVFALRGDVTRAAITQTDFPYAVDLVRFIRENYSNYFTICVAGYPEQHPQADSYRQDILYLKQKILAGADFIITQVILDSNSFIQFEKACRMAGITVPIIPGVLAVQSYQSLVHMSRLCHFNVPEKMLRDLEPIADNSQAVINYTLFHAVQMVKQLFTRRVTSGVHIFTLNRCEVPKELCRQLGLHQDEPVMSLLWQREDIDKEEDSEDSSST